jgi:hypothetical protein
VLHETEWHVEVFKHAKQGDNGGLGDVRRCHGNLVVAFHQIKDRKIPAAMVFIAEVSQGR